MEPLSAGSVAAEPISGSVQALSWLLFCREFLMSRIGMLTAACVMLPILGLILKPVFKAVRRFAVSVHVWLHRPPLWTIQLGALHLQLQEQYSSRFDKLEALLTTKLLELEERQTAGLVQMTTRQANDATEVSDSLHRAIKASSHQVSLDDGQLQRLRDLLSTEVAETQKVIKHHESILSGACKEVAEVKKMLSQHDGVFEGVNKQCKVLETLLDGVLAQGREIFQDHQGASKNILEKLTEKLVALDKLVDVIVQAVQKSANESHGGFVRLEQKMDKNHQSWWSEHGSLKSMVSAMIPMVREVRPAVCEGLPKGVSEVLRETTGVRSRVDDLPVDRAMQGLSEIIRVVHESKESLDQIWSWMSDLSRQVLEVSSLVQETETKVLDRLPKIPARKPPNQTGGASSSTQTDHPPAQQATHAVPETIRLQETIPAGPTQPIFVAAQSPVPQLIVAPPGHADPNIMLTPQQAAVIRSAFR